jgi:hypothetical protein
MEIARARHTGRWRVVRLERGAYSELVGPAIAGPRNPLAVPTMRTIRPLLVPFLLAGCASTSSSPGTRPSTETIAVGRVGARITHDQVPNAQATLPMGIAEVARALPDVYTAMGLPVRTQDAQSISTGLFVARSRLNGKRPSASLACGTQRGVENADAYEVVLQVQTRLTPLGNTTTTVESTVQATARPRGTDGSNPVTCSSSGAIEGEILRALGGPPVSVR